jgi:hypothetical protein
MSTGRPLATISVMKKGVDQEPSSDVKSPNN